MSNTPYVTVNGAPLSVDDVHTLLQVCDGLDVRATLQTYFAVIEYARAENITVTPEEVQAELDRFRRDAGLERETTVNQWRMNHQISDKGLELFCEIEAYRRKLIAHIPDEDIAEAFEDIKQDEDLYFLHALSFDSARKAEKVAKELRAEGLTFAEAVAQYGDRETRATSGFIGEMTKSELPENFRKSITSAKPGAIIGPIDEQPEWVILYLADRFEAEFEDYKEVLRHAIVEDDLDYYAERVVVMGVEA